VRLLSCQVVAVAFAPFICARVPGSSLCAMFDVVRYQPKRLRGNRALNLQFFGSVQRVS
jgi:hypothetical protein